ncbi:MAG: 2-C-methyl-D-erythritol 4-phosphate cytidylyltransferase [Alphaproteobacteria bacterium]|jgi:2-C-methyl-D-erythritol 4-phosphate cytidylyltransferase/2-C-methyl-D-erythritol 2,4-cyclodiphosphate synthase
MTDLRSNESPSIETVALIVAGGRGARAGGDLPKQYQDIAGKPMLRHVLDIFVAHPDIDAIQVVIHPDDTQLYESAIEGLTINAPVHGGATRQKSCRNGLAACQSQTPQNVLIHDAARPFVDADTITRVIDALATKDGAIAAIPVVDTLKKTDGANLISATIDRTALWRAQTPQGFHYQALCAAHDNATHDNFTDDAAVAEAHGLSVVTVMGSEENIKVTTPDDFIAAENRLRPDRNTSDLDAPDFRIGSGFDVHPFEAGDHAMLCGVRVPHDHGLAGHSDSDVGLHAITDALLGTIGAGDIGAHFPPSDPQWRGVDSSVFLRHAAGLVENAGGILRYLDVTLICEAPKIGPHRETMRARLAEILNLDLTRVSVKATTTDGLGFLGRGEGVAAQATATVLF